MAPSARSDSTAFGVQPHVRCPGRGAAAGVVAAGRASLGAGLDGLLNRGLHHAFSVHALTTSHSCRWTRHPRVKGHFLPSVGRRFGACNAAEVLLINAAESIGSRRCRRSAACRSPDPVEPPSRFSLLAADLASTPAFGRHLLVLPRGADDQPRALRNAVPDPSVVVRSCRTGAAQPHRSAISGLSRRETAARQSARPASSPESFGDRLPMWSRAVWCGADDHYPEQR